MPGRFAAQSKVRPDASRRRALAVALFLFLWMLVISARLVHLQVSQHDWFRARARAQQQDAVETSPVRGLILDRQGRELARSIDTDSFFAVPTEIKDVHEAATHLAPIIGVNASALATRLKEAKEANRKFVWLARKLDAEHSASIRDLGLEGVYAYKEPKRYYPNGALAAHVLGFVGIDEEGLAGVEQIQNAALVGEAGKLFINTDARRRTYDSFEVEPRPGQSIVLTIDQNIQYQTEQALAASVESARAKAGAAIVLDPHTGEILALANVPAFDPNKAHIYAPEARTNQALQNIYEPGSTFKIVAYVAALEEKLARPSDRIDCQMGAIRVAGRVIHDSHPYGTLTVTEALAKSSNVAAIKLGLRVGNERMYDYITRFGFGAQTGVELPGETAGLLRPVARWQPSSIGSIAMGQEIGVTPLQVASAFGTIANDGLRIAPHLVRELRAADGTVLRRATPGEQRVVSADTAQTLRQMLESVTLRGTAKLAQLEAYTAAGKTGTAQKIDPRTRAYSKTKYVASFVGFAPVENPSVVIIVVIDEPMGSYYGGAVAAPVFREIAERVLPYLTVMPDEEPAPMTPTWEELAARSPAGGDSGVPQESEIMETEKQATLPEIARDDKGRNGSEIVYAAATNRALLMPDLRGRSVRDVARICAQIGLELEARGEGRALRQIPEAGADVESGQVVRVDFGRGN